MIKGFKNGLYNMSSKAVIGGLLAAVVVFTNGISVSALDAGNFSEKTANEVQETAQNGSQFLIDEEIKCYDDINKVKKYAGFDFKLPDYIGNANWEGGYQLIKLTNTNNALVMYFMGGDNQDFAFSLAMFKDDPIQSLEKVLEIKSAFKPKENDECKVSEREANYGNVKGKDITLTITTPEYTKGKYTIPKSVRTVKYFLWEDNNVYYAIEYNNSLEENGHKGSWIDISQDEAGKIANSFKELNDIKNVDYKTDFSDNRELSTETGIMSIYDKDDLKKAEGILGFNPKMPLNFINNNVVVHGSGVGITGDSDVEKNKINYDLNLFYNYGNKGITFNQSKHDSFDVYKRIKENGYVDRSADEWSVNKKISVDKIDIDGKIVYKYMESFKNPEENQSEASTEVYYKWEENGVYCSLAFFDTDQYQDEIVKEFVNSKTID